MNKKIISAIILIFSIIGVFLSINHFRMLKNPSNICDCKTQDKLYFISRLLSSDSAISSRIYRRQQMRACIYNYIYKSKTYNECAILGPKCADFLFSKGINCTMELCGVLTTKEYQDKITEDANFLSDPDWVKKTDEGKRLLSAIEENTAKGDMTKVAELNKQLSAYIKSEIDKHSLSITPPEELVKILDERNPYNYLEQRGCK